MVFSFSFTAIAAIVCLGSLAATPTLAGHTPTQMTTNGRINPLGIPADDISFSWAIASEARGSKQSAYQVRVSTKEGGDDVWNSGRVESDRQVDISLPADRSLASATRYFWQVKTWDQNNLQSDWSAPAWFETGLLSENDWSAAAWIGRSAPSIKPQDWKDYTVSVEFTLQNEAFGVFLRATPDAQSGLMFQVNVAGATPIFKPHKRIRGTYEELARVDLAKLGFTREQLLRGKQKLTFEIRGNKITSVLNGKVIDEREDDSFPSGLIGFRTHGQERAAVHRVKVSDAPGGRVLLDSEFENGESGFAGGELIEGSLQIAGMTEAIYTGEPNSLPILRGTFTAREDVKSARLYASALGLYEVSVNGQKAGDQFLAPGWTDYHQRIQHQTYDVTDLVKKGPNAVGAMLADGWYRGHVGIHWSRAYGESLGFIAKIKLTYADGSVEWFQTNRDWRAGDGPLVRADLQDGERYDAAREQAGWNTTAFDASTWTAVEELPAPRGKLVPQPDEPIRVIDTLTAKSRATPLSKKHVYDLGQNMVGVARVTMKGRKGQTVTIRYAEELYRIGERKGQLYTDNFRKAKVTDTYTFAVDGTVTYQPTFTQHGFRYVELSGLDDAPPIEAVQGIVLGSALPETGELITSHPMLNQLVSNIRWGQRGNFLSIPTDTPARDERLGWTGDISVFAPTAARYQDTRAFLSKWMDDVRDSQKPDGNLPAVVPQPRKEFDQTGVGWSDAFITVPYSVWRATGDLRIVRRNWEAMQRFYRFVHESATKDGNLIEEGRSSWFSGDWLSLEKVDRLEEHKVIATAYFAENTRMMAEMAAAMGESEKSAEWSALVPKIREAFVAKFREADGTIYTGTQTAYAMALALDMITDERQREQTAQKFLDKLEADNHHLKTGFLGTPCLLPALTKINRNDLAMRLLLNEDYPSWGFEIRMGATTIWERWNTIRADGQFGPVDMNSFNHYAYGAVGDWMFEHLGGLQILEPGYKKVRIAPLIKPNGLSHAKCSLRTPAGLIECEWTLKEGELTLAITIPANTTAELTIPAKNLQSVRAGQFPAASRDGVREATFVRDRLTLVVGSGRYAFTSPGITK